VAESLAGLLFFASFLGPLGLEYWMHKRASARLARLAFVEVGRCPLARANEQVESTRETYRAGEVRRGPPLFPAREWSLRGPNDGTIDVVVERGRRHAIVRLDIPWKRRSLWGPRPTRAVATIRIEPVPADAGWALRATALPHGLVAFFGVPFFVLAIDDGPHPLVSFGVVLAMVSVGTALFQAAWWLFYGGVVRESVAQALRAVSDAIESDAAPIVPASRVVV